MKISSIGKLFLFSFPYLSILRGILKSKNSLLLCIFSSQGDNQNQVIIRKSSSGNTLITEFSLVGVSGSQECESIPTSEKLTRI